MLLADKYVALWSDLLPPYECIEDHVVLALLTAHQHVLLHLILACKHAEGRRHIAMFVLSVVAVACGVQHASVPQSCLQVV